MGSPANSYRYSMFSSASTRVLCLYQRETDLNLNILSCSNFVCSSTSFPAEVPLYLAPPPTPLLFVAQGHLSRVWCKPAQRISPLRNALFTESPSPLFFSPFNFSNLLVNVISTHDSFHMSIFFLRITAFLFLASQLFFSCSTKYFLFFNVEYSLLI